MFRNSNHGVLNTCSHWKINLKNLGCGPLWLGRGREAPCALPPRGQSAGAKGQRDLCATASRMPGDSLYIVILGFWLEGGLFL